MIRLPDWHHVHTMEVYRWKFVAKTYSRVHATKSGINTTKYIALVTYCLKEHQTLKDINVGTIADIHVLYSELSCTSNVAAKFPISLQFQHVFLVSYYSWASCPAPIGCHDLELNNLYFWMFCCFIESRCCIHNY